MAKNKVSTEFDIKSLKRHSQWGDIFARFRKRKIAVIGAVIVLVIILLSLLAPLISPFDYYQIDPANGLQYPSWQHLFGTDKFGRDIFARILYGGRTSLIVALMGCAISTIIGGALGAVAGYYGKWVDTSVMRVVDVLMSIPGTLIAVCVSALLGNGIWQTAIAVSIGGIAHNALLLRATVLGIRGQEYIEAGKAYGSGDARMILKHVLPNCLAPLIVNVTLALGSNILLISGLSFIGLGVQPPTAEWGSMLNEGRAVIRQFWPMVVFPGAAIALSMLGFNLAGDGLRDALDPKQKH